MYQLAQTKMGALVVYKCDPDDSEGMAEMEVYANFEELHNAEGDPYPENVIAAFAEALGEDYSIELDI